MDSSSQYLLSTCSLHGAGDVEKNKREAAPALGNVTSNAGDNGRGDGQGHSGCQVQEEANHTERSDPANCSASLEAERQNRGVIVTRRLIIT